jgi:hypothetical protein
MPLITLKIVVFNAIPRPKATTAMIVNAGALRSVRAA